MKKTLTATALILATAGSAAFAQGMEGQQIGYNAGATTQAAYSTRNATSDALNLDNLRAEAPSEATVTVFATTEAAQKDSPFVR